MDKYITGSVIRRLRVDKKMTQEDLAKKICVSSKAISKWETGQGFPDISLIEPLSRALNISVIEDILLVRTSATKISPQTLQKASFMFARFAET